MRQYQRTWRTTPYGGRIRRRATIGGVWVIVGMLATLAALTWLLWLYTAQLNLTQPEAPPTIPTVGNRPLTIQQKIVAYTSNVPDETALRIAKCESQYGKYTDNPTSTATGLYQFTETTWEHYCSGNIHDPIAQIQCFDDLYPKHPTWWECA